MNIGLFILAFGSFGVIVIILAYFVTKSQSKYIKTLKVGDVVNYNGKPAKILELDDEKARVESVVPSMSLGNKVNMDEYTFE